MNCLCFSCLMIPRLLVTSEPPPRPYKGRRLLSPFSQAVRAPCLLSGCRANKGHPMATPQGPLLSASPPCWPPQCSPFVSTSLRCLRFRAPSPPSWFEGRQQEYSAWISRSDTSCPLRSPPFHGESVGNIWGLCASSLVPGEGSHNLRRLDAAVEAVLLQHLEHELGKPGNDHSCISLSP